MHTVEIFSLIKSNHGNHFSNVLIPNIILRKIKLSLFMLFLYNCFINNYFIYEFFCVHVCVYMAHVYCTELCITCLWVHPCDCVMYMPRKIVFWPVRWYGFRWITSINLQEVFFCSLHLYMFINDKIRNLDSLFR